MPDKNIELIDEIIQKIKDDKFEAAKTLFSKLLDQVKDLPYSEWSEEYIDKVEEFGELFDEHRYRKYSYALLELLEKKIKEDKSEAWFYIELALLFGLEEYKTIINKVDATQIYRNPLIISIKTKSLVELQRYDDALKFIDYELKKEKHSIYFETKALILWELKDFEEALNYIDRALSIDNERSLKEKPDYYSYKAVILRDQRRLPLAINSIDKALELLKKEEAGYNAVKAAKFYAIKASILREEEKFDEAMVALDKAINLDRGKTSYQDLKALHLWQAGLNKEAFDIIETILNSETDPPAYLYHTKAVILLDLGNPLDAIKNIDLALEKVHDKFERALYLDTKANILLSLGNPQEARKNIEKALRLEKRPEYYDTQAAILEELGEYDGAKKSIDEATKTPQKRKQNITLKKLLEEEYKTKPQMTNEDRKKRETIVNAKDVYEKLNKLTLKTEREINDLKIEQKNMVERIDKEKIHLIEFLGVFTAILAFVVVSQNIVLNHSLVESMLLMPGFALALVIFVLGIHYLADSKKNDSLLWVVLFLLIFFIASVCVANYLGLLNPISNSVNGEKQSAISSTITSLTTTTVLSTVTTNPLRGNNTS